MLRTVSYPCALSIILLSLLPSPVQATTTLPAASIPVVFRDTLASSWLDSHVVIQQGHRAPGGCAFPVSLSKAATEGPVALLELSYDPSTCQARVKSGHVKRTAGGDPIIHAEWGWNDGFGIPLNDVTPAVQWSYDYAHVSGCSSWDSTWQQIDFWYRTGHSNSGGVDSGSTECYSQSYASFENDVLCGYTATWYEPVTVAGYTDGSSNTWGTTYPSGNCTGRFQYWVQIY